MWRRSKKCSESILNINEGSIGQRREHERLRKFSSSAVDLRTMRCYSLERQCSARTSRGRFELEGGSDDSDVLETISDDESLNNEAETFSPPPNESRLSHTEAEKSPPPDCEKSPALAENIAVVQKTQSFFNILKNRFNKTQTRDQDGSPKQEQEDVPASPLICSSPEGVKFDESGRLNDYDGDQDNSQNSTPHKSPRRWNKHFLHHRQNGQEQQDSAQLAALRQHEFFLLKLYLKHGRGLPAMDSGGTSDPFIKMKLAGKMVCKSKIIYKSLNPLWDETFDIPVEDPFQPLQLKVFDHDWGMNDDFMGEAILEISSLELEKEKEFTFNLTDPNKANASLGSITLTAVLSPRSKEEHFQSVSGAKSSDFKKQKNQQWDSVVNVVLVEAKDLMAMDSEGTSDPYVKCRLGSEKYRSKVVSRTLNPRWLEQFDMHFFDSGSQIFEMEVFDHDARSKDDFMGKACVNVANLEKEKTHDIWTELEDGAGTIHVLITISGVTSVETPSDLLVYKEDVEQLNDISKRYSLKETFKQIKDIGYLTVRVFKAHGLTSADIGGKSDPFCVLELVNARLQTQTEYKTLSPQWNKIFFFNVKDIHSVLEVTIYDEDKDHKMEFLGKVSIPLLKIRCGERRWYALKDKKLLGRAKGSSPQVLLEMDLVWNSIRAGVRTLNPREEKYTQEQVKFKRAIFLRNVNRLKVMGASMAEGAAFAKSILDWESKPRTIIAFIVFMVAVYSFELYMAPVGILLALLKGWLVNLVTAGYRQSDDDDYVADDEDEEEDREKTSKKAPQEDEKKSLKEKLMAVQEVTAMVQNIMGYIASLGECVQNTFNFTVPFLSWLAVFVMSVVTIVLYLIPIRYLIMLWGCHKFSKKLLRPNAIPNNELADFLSRVPDNDQLRQYRELRPTKISDTDRRREQRQKSQQQKKTA